MTMLSDGASANSGLARENAHLGTSLQQQADQLSAIGRAVNFVVIGQEYGSGYGKGGAERKVSRVESILAMTESSEKSASPAMPSEKRHALPNSGEKSGNKNKLAAGIVSKAIGRVTGQTH